MSDRKSWGEGAYAGFWRRAAGWVIDVIVITALVTVLAVLTGIVFGVALLAGGSPEAGETGGAGAQGVVQLLGWLVAVVPGFLYDTVMTSKLGWTLGKRAVGVEVRHADGELLTFGQAAGRYLGRIVSSLPFMLGYLWAAWDPHKQTWHDKFVRCFVLAQDDLASHTPAALDVQRPWGGYSGWGIPGAPRPDLEGGPQEAGAGTEPGGVLGDEEVRVGEGAPPAGAVPEWPAPGEAGGGAVEPEADRLATTESHESAAEPASDWREPASGAASEGSGDRPVPPGDTHEAGTGSEPPDMGNGLGPPGRPGPVLEGDTLESAHWAFSDADAEAPATAHTPETPATPDISQAPAAGTPGQPGGDAGLVRDAGGTSPDPDPNEAAIVSASIPAEAATWLQQVAEQVDGRLDRVAPDWRSASDAPAARACAFGLLLGHLATVYPHMAEDLDRVAEAHPSFTTLGNGSRLATLQEVAGDADRAAGWLGPLIGGAGPADVQALLD